MRTVTLQLGLLVAVVAVALRQPANGKKDIAEPNATRVEQLLNQSEDFGPPGYIFEKRSSWEKVRDGWSGLWNPPARIAGGIMR